MSKWITFASVAILLSAAVPAASRANDQQRFRTEYTIAAFGLPIGKAGFETSITDAGAYSVDGTLRSSGIARIIAAINGSLTAKGLFGGDKASPSEFAVTYTEGKKTKTSRFTFSGNTITGAQNEPPVRKRGKWVPLDASQLVDAADPISAGMLYAARPRDVCNRTIKAFDGAMRMDIKLSYLRTVPFSARGFKGDIVTCRGRFVPIAGYDADKQDIKWMQQNGDFEIGFAPIAETSFHAPVSAKVKTRLVTVRARATRFEQLTN
ncbi:MAG: DUF3108 domain-containing protein [Pseudomonadota bacterium]